MNNKNNNDINNNDVINLANIASNVDAFISSNSNSTSSSPTCSSSSINSTNSTPSNSPPSSGFLYDPNHRIIKEKRRSRKIPTLLTKKLFSQEVFDPSNDKQIEEKLNQLNKRTREEKSAKYNFDFEKDTPYEGVYKWARA
eukprot:TRINITY_DN1650_c2_g1_i1.p1 TRINITY_DN1650_c2_g1~~TRINITY_DN1650_c2_g1_i1.p1  ORF type:complete len:141 (+),score=69.85 TRINITY_DN1650_c2_g1_i1:76-498(+)